MGFNSGFKGLIRHENPFYDQGLSFLLGSPNKQIFLINKISRLVCQITNVCFYSIIGHAKQDIVTNMEKHVSFHVLRFSFNLHILGIMW